MTLTRTRSRQFVFPRGRSLAAVTLIFGLAQIPIGHAADVTQPFCIPQVINVPGPNFQQPPSVDGTVSGDFGWTSARQHVFVNGTPVVDARVQVLRNVDFLYFSFEVNHDTQFDATDSIYIAFDPTGTGVASNLRLLRIRPVIPAGVASPVPINYWHGFPWSGGGASPPADTTVAATTSGVAPNVSWFVELSIRRTAFGIPASGPFGIYFNIVPQVDDIAFNYQYRWPEGTTPMSGNPLLDPTILAPLWADFTEWGQATTAATTCNGVYIAASDIRTDNVPPSKINLNAPNTFRVTAHNSTVDATGTPIAANNVRATFKIANFGLPSQWTAIIPTSPATNPTSSGNIAAGGTRDFTTQWTLTGTQPSDYNTPATRHQCILVELDTSPVTNTLFATRSAWTNMNFGLASKFESNAEIDPRGWPKPADGKPHAIELVVTARTDELKPGEVLRQMNLATSREQPSRRSASDGLWSSLAQPMHFPVERNESWKEFVAKLDSPNARVSQSTQLFHGCRRTGIFLDVGGGRKSEFCERVGSFGYVVRHSSLGQAIAWNLDVAGPELKKSAKPAGGYQMLVPAGKPVSLNTSISALDQVTGDGGSGKNGGCGNIKFSQIGNGGDATAMAGSVFVVGSLGIGGLAFLRRRKSKLDIEKKEHQS